MYVATSNLVRGPRAAMPMRERRRRPRSPYRLSGLGATCWLDAKSGAQVCGGGDPTGQLNCNIASPFYQPTSGGLSPVDGRPPRSMSLGGNVLTVNPASGNRRVYTFLYHAGWTDVYQRSAGGKCGGSGCDYAAVNSSGMVTFSNKADAKNELGCSNITTATAVQVPGANTYATTSSFPVYTGAPSGVPSSPGFITLPTIAPDGAGGGDGIGGLLGKIPTWALIGGAGVGGLMLLRMAGGRR